MSHENIEKVIMSLMDSWDLKDPKAFANNFREKSIFTNVIGDVAEGREAIEQMHIFPFTGPLKDAYQSYRITHILWINSEVAVADLKWQCFNQKIPGTEEVLPPRNGLINLVITIEDTEWKITAGYNTDYTGTYQRKGEREGEVTAKKQLD